MLRCTTHGVSTMENSTDSSGTPWQGTSHGNSFWTNGSSASSKRIVMCGISLAFSNVGVAEKRRDLVISSLQSSLLTWAKPLAGTMTAPSHMKRSWLSGLWTMNSWSGRPQSSSGTTLILLSTISVCNAQSGAEGDHKWSFDQLKEWFFLSLCTLYHLVIYRTVIKWIIVLMFS